MQGMARLEELAQAPAPGTGMARLEALAPITAEASPVPLPGSAPEEWQEGLPDTPTAGELMAGGFEGLDLEPAGTPGPAAPPAAASKLPPGVVEIDGVYLRQMPDGSLLPVGEKGLGQPLYDPIEFTADVLTGGLTGAARLAGKSVVGLASRQGLGELVRQGVRPVAGAALASAGRDAAYGALAGGTMEAVDHATGNKAGAMLAGLGAPAAAILLPTMVRRGMISLADGAGREAARAVRQAAGEGLDATAERMNTTVSKITAKAGMLSEAIGPEAYDAVARNEAQQALAGARVAAETGEFTLRPWVQNLLKGIPGLRGDRALILGQSLRDVVNRLPGVGEALASRLGMSGEQLYHLSRLAEAIPAQPLDRDGFLRLGIRETVKDADGVSIEAWRHGLDPAAARAEIARLSPAEQKFLLAYVEPAQGYHTAPRLAVEGATPGPGVDRGELALEAMSQRTGMSPAELAANFQMHGRNKFTAGFGSGSKANQAQAMEAAEHLEENVAKYLRPITHQEPTDLAGPAAIARLEAQGLARPGDNLPKALRELGREEFIRAHGGGPEAHAAAGYLEELARQREMVTHGKLAKELRDTAVPTPEWVFERAGVKPAKVFADYATLQRKHPDQFATAEDVRAHVEYVMAGPKFFLPATKPEYTLLVRRNGADKAAVVEFQVRGGKYRVRSAYLLTDGQLERKLAKAADQGGSSGPPSPARDPQAGGVSSGSPTAPSNAVRLDPTGSMVDGAGGEVKAGPGKLAADQTVGQAKDLGNVLEGEPNPPRLAAGVGRAAADWRRPDWVHGGEIMLPWTPRKPFEKASGISREVNRRDLVELGILAPRQKIEGYVTHAGLSDAALAAAAEAGRINQQRPELDLSPMTPAAARERIDKLSGMVPRLDEAITAYRTAAEQTKAQRAMLAKLGPLLLDPVEPRKVFRDGAWMVLPGDPPAGSLVRERSEWSPYHGKEVTRQEALSLVDVGPVEAEALGVRPGRYTIPAAFAERFEVLLGRVKTGKLDTPLEGLGALVRDLARYWKTNVLAAPGTLVTNLLGGLSQYSSKVGEDVVRHGFSNPRRLLDDIAAPVHALRPSMIEAVPAEILGGNVATQFGREASEFYKGVNARLAAGEKVGLSSRALGAVSEFLLKGLNLMLKPFGAIENYMKRTIYLSEIMDWARRESRSLAAQGEKVDPRDLVASVFQRRPDLHREIMQGAVDRFGYDYDNIPTGLKRFRDSVGGAAIFPFPIYPYKYGRAILNQANAINPLNRGLSLKERAARFGGGLALPVLGFEAGRRYLAGGDSQAQTGLDEFDREFGDTEVKVAYPRLGGREHIGSYTDMSPDPRDKNGQPQGWGKEVFLRTAKYGYFNLPRAFHSGEDFKAFVDEFKTTGPTVAVVMNLLGFHPRLGPKDFAGQAGELVSGLIPLHRNVEFVARLNDEFRRRAPRGFFEQIMEKFPGGREYLHQPQDKWAGKLAQENRIEEWLKYMAGVNLRTVDVNDAKEALSEAVARASERELQDGQRLAVYERFSGLSRQEIEPHLARIRQAETNGMLAYRQFERTFFGQALVATANKFNPMDPGQAQALTNLKQKAGREVVTKGLGAHSQKTARQGMRLAAGLAWIEQNLKGGRNAAEQQD